jgi:hypothetical protein
MHFLNRKGSEKKNGLDVVRDDELDGVNDVADDVTRCSACAALGVQ